MAMSVPKFKEQKEKEKLVMVTCYDSTFAKIVEGSAVDGVLVGDSVAMVVYGYDSTVHATTSMIAKHVEAVRRGGYTGFLVADIPFLSLQKSDTGFVLEAQLLVQSGANALKVEGVQGAQDKIKKLILSGVPVMGHVGLTPQFLNKFGGFKVQGRTQETQEHILNEAKEFEELGCFSVVLECVPEALAKDLSKRLSIPTIGIGAGLDVDGQILVLQDLLGLNDHKFKFVKKYEDLFSSAKEALNQYSREVKEGVFPGEEHKFS